MKKPCATCLKPQEMYLYCVTGLHCRGDVRDVTRINTTYDSIPTSTGDVCTEVAILLKLKKDISVLI